MIRIFKYGNYGDTIFSSPAKRVTRIVHAEPAYQQTAYIIGGAEPAYQERSIPLVDENQVITVPVEGDEVVESLPTSEAVESAQNDLGLGLASEGRFQPSGDDTGADADIVQVTEEDLEGKSWWNWKSFGIGVGASAGFFGLIWLLTSATKKRKR